MAMVAHPPNLFGSPLHHNAGHYYESPQHYQQQQQQYHTPLPYYNNAFPSNYSPPLHLGSPGMAMQPNYPPPSTPPPNLTPTYSNSEYVALDCEFVGVGLDGVASALARVSLCSWSGEVLLDTFCAPAQAVSDYRSWVSGVREADLLGAPSFEDVQRRVAAILANKVLVGHAVHNDLAVLQIDHPPAMIRDTSSYNPLQVAARTSRPSLRGLARIVLGLDIQTGEHSSIEDARVTMSIFKVYQAQWEAGLAARSPQSARSATTFAHTAPPSSPETIRYHHSPALSGNARPFSINVNLPNRSASSPVARMQSSPGPMQSPYSPHSANSSPGRQASGTPSSFFPSISANAFMDPRYSAALATLPSMQSPSPPPGAQQRALRYQVPTQSGTISPKSYAKATTATASPVQDLSPKPWKPTPPRRNESMSPISSNERTPSPFSSPSGGDESVSSEDLASLKPTLRRTVSSSSIPPWSSAPQKLPRKKRGNRAYKRKESEEVVSK